VVFRIIVAPVPNQQFAIMSREPANAHGMAALGSRREIVASLTTFNTAPDREGADETLYGPGILISLPPEADPVTQMLVVITEEEIGWQVVLRLGKHFKWKLVDMSTGRELNP
jgi:hypothetical protein